MTSTSLPNLTAAQRRAACETIADHLGLPSESVAAFEASMPTESIIKNMDSLWSDGGFAGWLAFIRECELRSSRIDAQSSPKRIDPLREAVRELYMTIRATCLLPNPDLEASSQLLIPYKLVTRLQPYESIKAASLDIDEGRAYLVLETAETKTSRGRDKVTHSLRLITWRRDSGDNPMWRVDSDFSTVSGHSEYVLRGRITDLIAHLDQRRQELDNLRRQLNR